MWKQSVGAGMLVRTVQQLKHWLPPRLEGACVMIDPAF
jgi:hypothetical protein